MSNVDAVIQAMTEQISIAGQLSESQLAQLPTLGFQAVLNVRSHQEKGAMSDEQSKIEALGIPYVNIPVNPQMLDDALINQVVGHIEALPKPLLVHCGSALRAAFMVMLYQVTRQNVGLDLAKTQSAELGFDFDQKPPFKTAITQYFATKESS